MTLPVLRRILQIHPELKVTEFVLEGVMTNPSSARAWEIFLHHRSLTQIDEGFLLKIIEQCRLEHSLDVKPLSEHDEKWHLGNMLITAIQSKPLQRRTSKFLVEVCGTGNVNYLTTF